MSPSRAWLVMVAILLAAGTLYFTQPPLRPEIHLVLSKWCHGISTGKIGFFLITMTVGLLWLIARESWPRTTSPQPPPRLGASLGLLTIAFMLTGWLASLTSCLIYHHDFVLDSPDVSYHWLAGFPSVNSLQHIHTSKSPLASTIDLLGLSELHARFDTGLAYAKVVPIWLQLILGVCFLMSLALGLVASGRLIDRFTPASRAAAGLAWLIAWTWGTKCILDGGPLGYDAILSLIIAAAIVARSANLSLRSIRSLIAAALALWLAIHLILSLDGALWQILRLLERAAWLIALLGITLRLSPPRSTRPVLASHLHDTPPSLHTLPRIWATWSVILPAWSLAMVMLALSHASEVAPLRQSATTAIATELTDDDGLVTFRPVAVGGECLDCAQLYAKLGDQPSRVRRISLAHNRPPAATGMHMAIRPIAQSRSVSLSSRGDIELVSIEPVTDPRGTWLMIDLAFPAGRGPVVVDGWGQRGQLLENERFIAMLATDRYLHHAGITQYIMVPQGFYARKPAEQSDAAQPTAPQTPK